MESGALVDAETADYSTALQLAAGGGHAGCCRALLEAGAMVDAQGGPQRSAALHLAAAGGHTPTVRLLLGEGADTDLRDRQVVRVRIAARPIDFVSTLISARPDRGLLARACHLRCGPHVHIKAASPLRSPDASVTGAAARAGPSDLGEGGGGCGVAGANGGVAVRRAGDAGRLRRGGTFGRSAPPQLHRRGPRRRSSRAGPQGGGRSMGQRLGRVDRLECTDSERPTRICRPNGAPGRPDRRQHGRPLDADPPTIAPARISRIRVSAAPESPSLRAGSGASARPITSSRVCSRLYPSLSISRRLYPSLSVCRRLYPSLSVCRRLYPSPSVCRRLYPSPSVCRRLYPSLRVGSPRPESLS